MTERRTVFGVRPESVHEFLEACLTSQPPEGSGDEPVSIEQLLQEQLAEKCPRPQLAARSQSRLLASVEEKVWLDLSRPVREVLLDDQADLDTLRDIKDRYKKWAEKAADKNLQHIYTAIYYAAIARALVSHHKRITRHAPTYLADSFQRLAGVPWMIPALRELYLQAQQACP